MDANPILLQKKYARVINKFAECAGISTRKAIDFFYQSITYQDMSEGLSDMHCRSDGYLAEELREEFLSDTTEQVSSGEDILCCQE